MDHDIEAVMQRLTDLIAWADRAERDCSNILTEYRSVRDEPDEELDEAEERLAAYTRDIYRELRLLARVLHLESMVPEIEQAERKYGDLKSMELDKEVSVFWSGALRDASGTFRSLSAVAGSNATPALRILHNMLDQTGHVIEDLQLQPENEGQIRNVILRIIRYAFPDARKEHHAPNNVTNFRMDVAVPSLGAVAEYKFADTPKALQECLNGIYSDMTGYSGNSEWKHFFAVIYMSGPYLTQREVEAEFKRVRAKANWTPVIVVGPGQRKPRPPQPVSPP